jgi:hypothetical protein
MTEAPEEPGVAPTLLARFRSAEPRIEWRPAGRRGAPPSRPGVTLQIAHLFQEEARVLRSEHGESLELRVDAGPVGALVLLLEVDRRGAPRELASLGANVDPQFPGGAFVALWGERSGPAGSAPLRATDLVELARYALA